jgi:hypothetical protein
MIFSFNKPPNENLNISDILKTKYIVEIEEMLSKQGKIIIFI